MRPISPVLATLSLLGALACGGSKTTAPPANTNTGTGSTRTMTVTYNGVAYNPNLLLSAYLGGSVTVNASDGPRNLSISALNANATGAYSAANGNANSLLVQWVDANNGTFSSIGTGAGGTVTFTVLQLGRVAGSLNVTVRNSSNQTASGLLTIAGTFDIKYP